MSRRKILGELLVASGTVSSAEVDAALQRQRETGERLGQVLVEAGAADAEDVARALALQLGIPYQPPPLEPSPDAAALIPADLARSRSVLPLARRPRRLVLAMADPLDVATADDLRFMTGRTIDVVAASPAAVVHGLAAAYETGFADLAQALPTTLQDGGDASRVSTDALHEAVRSEPVVRLVDEVLRRAALHGASDIHIEETGSAVRVRYRVDGVLRRVGDLPAASRRAVLSRIKVMAGMDISVRRRAQDGRIPLCVEDRSLNLRVSTLPVNGGEKAVIRILDPESIPQGLDTLGFSSAHLQQVRRILSSREGVVLVTGPTGCGKSTTLFAALSEMDREVHNVVTVEDPVEYRLPGTSQVQVSRAAGLSFADALRSILRQDPDVVMVGEIRDRETAEIAMTAAVTGHLVLSTLHTTDAPGAVTRLLDMGVPPYLVSGGLTAVIAQRLVRRSCRTCRGTGCDICHDGFRGRTGIFQILTFSDALRDAISRNAPTARIRELARRSGMNTLSEDATRIVAEGLTTPLEAGRIVHSDPGNTLPCRACGAQVPLGAPGCPHCGAPQVRSCSCGRILQRGWKFCPWCIRKAS